MKNRYYIIVLLTALCFTSCGVYKPYKSSVQVPEQTVPQWREVFTDPCLQALIDSTLKNNNDEEIARLNIRQAEIAYSTSKLGYLPTFSFTPTGGISKYGSADHQWSYNLGITAQWQLDIFGASITNTKRKKSALLEYQKDYKQAVDCQLIASMAQLYYQLLGYEKQLQIQKEMKVLYEKTYESTQHLFLAGQYTSAAVSESKAQLENLVSSIVDLEYNIDNTKKSICQLMNVKPYYFQYGKLDNIVLPAIATDGVPADRLGQRPDIRAAQRQIEAAFYDVQLAKGALYPSITIKANGGWMNPTTWFADALASLVQPIFQGGQLRANVKISKLEQEKVLVNFQRKMLDAYYDVTYALDDIKVAADKKPHLKAQVESLNSTVDATQELMNNGSATYLEVLTAMKELLTARNAEVTNQISSVHAMINLYGAIGGK